jgi:hypothetical protein
VLEGVKELSHMLMKTGKSKIYRAGGRPRKELILLSSVQRHTEGRIPSLYLNLFS